MPDVSVVAKWLLDERDSPQARDLLRWFLDGEVHLVIPSLLYYEAGNVLRFNRTARAPEVEEFLHRLHALQLEEVPPSRELSLAAYREARAVGPKATVYDCTYLAVARQRQGVMVTADLEFDRMARSRHVASLDKVHRDLA